MLRLHSFYINIDCHLTSSAFGLIFAKFFIKFLTIWKYKTSTCCQGPFWPSGAPARCSACTIRCYATDAEHLLGSCVCATDWILWRWIRHMSLYSINSLHFSILAELIIHSGCFLTIKSSSFSKEESLTRLRRNTLIWIAKTCRSCLIGSLLVL